MSRISRTFSSTAFRAHENPLGLPRRTDLPPQIPRKLGPIERRPIPNVKKVVAVASGKGGVGKSTVAVNMAFSLAMRKGTPDRRLRVGILDLDIFGPSIPTLMGLQHAQEPQLTSKGALVPLTNHGIGTMSMGFLIPKPDLASALDTPIVWRGLMVQKAVQQLLFDVDWTGGEGGPGLDVLVVDMPPGTGDVPLTLGQLVKVDGSMIVSTPQDVALSDVRKGIAMLRKISVPITGLLLNQSHFICPSCSTAHELFGSPDAFRATADRLGIPVLAELPLVAGVSSGGDKGIPFSLIRDGCEGGRRWKEAMDSAAAQVWQRIHSTG